MTGKIDVKDELLRIAEDLRPKGKGFVSVLEIAHSLGTCVSLRFQNSRSSNTAQIDFRSRPPKILVFRFCQSEGEHEINWREENLLSPRERFSVAHELGHWLLFSRFDTEPQSDERLYWAQEDTVNAFAAHLLLPDWLARDWLEGTADDSPISPFALRFWATQNRVSEEVVVKALARQRSSIGFLKLFPTQRKRDGKPVLQVLASASGGDVRLPNERSHIDSGKLWNALQDKKVGTDWFSQLQLGRCAPQNLYVAWRRGNRVGAEEVTWVSLLKRDTKPDKSEMAPPPRLFA